MFCGENVPYKRIGDVPASILGIKPRVTLEQANLIAEWADAIAEENPDGAWPIAIAQFKRKYTVRGGKWVERVSLKKEGATEEDTMPSNLTIDIDGEAVTVEALIETYRASLQEQKMKTVGGEKFPASDFLVTEDPEKPSTWHLQVKRHGKADHNLMGGAKGALTDPNYRGGNPYQGPEKSAALRKLKALYKSEGLDFNEAAVDAEENGDMAEPMMIVQGPTTFADLLARKAAREAADQVYELTYQFQMLANNTMASPDITDKLAALKTLAAEYVTLIEAAMAGVQTGNTEETESAETAAEELAESESGQAVSLVEVADGPPAVVDVEIIQPGWGNTRDNHFYPAEVLARDAGVFKGAKMYATDHKPEQKSVLTEVSTILDIVGISAGGAPIARVGIHNPEFAADVRNRAKLGVLSELHCSILAKGTARDYAENGRKGKLVESITAVQSVDWVTRAGAGGHAVALVENAQEPPITESSNPAQTPEIQTQEGQAAVTEAAQVEAQPVTISEAAPQPAPVEPVAEVAPLQPAPVSEVFLSEADVATELGKRPALHAAIKARVVAGKYHTLEEFNAVLEHEIVYFKELTGSGSPFAQGVQQGEKPLTAEERERRSKERFNRIMKEVGGFPV